MTKVQRRVLGVLIVVAAAAVIILNVFVYKN